MGEQKGHIIDILGDRLGTFLSCTAQKKPTVRCGGGHPHPAAKASRHSLQAKSTTS